MATTSLIKTVHPKNRLFAAGLSRTGLRIFQTGANDPGRARSPAQDHCSTNENPNFPVCFRNGVVYLKLGQWV